MMRTMEPVLPRRPSPEVAVPLPKKNRTAASRYPLIVLIILLVATMGWLIWRHTSEPSVIPLATRQSVSFALYQPSRMPAGYSVDVASFNTTQQVVTFTVNYDRTKKLIFSEQPKPATLDFTNFYTQQLSDAQAFTTPIGQVAIGTYQGVGLATISANQTWILIRAPSGIDSTQFEQIARNLK